MSQKTQYERLRIFFCQRALRHFVFRPTNPCVLLYLRLRTPLRRDTGEEEACCHSFHSSYRHISPLVRPVLPGTQGSLWPGTQGSLCLPWYSGAGTVSGVPVKTEDYRLRFLAVMHNCTVGPLNEAPPGGQYFFRGC